MSQGMPARISETSRTRSYDTRQNRHALRTFLSGPTPKGDKYVIIPILAGVFATVVSPLEYVIFHLPADTTRLDTRVFWPVMAAISAVLAAKHRSRLRRPLPLHIVCFLGYVAF